MDLQLEGKRALITGSTGGIGFAIAKTLATEGAIVAIHGRNAETVSHIAQKIILSGGKAVTTIGDLSTDEGANAIAEQIQQSLNGIDILINNAGTFPAEAWLTTPAKDWVTLYDQNVGSMVRMIQHFVPAMKAQGWGRVIAISSLVSTMPLAQQASYSATKAANVNLAVSLAKELAGTGVTSNAVSPGPILTEGFQEFALARAGSEGWESNIAAIEKRWATEIVPNPTGRMGRPEDIADAVTFLASPRAGFINGANLRVDGGTVPTIN